MAWMYIGSEYRLPWKVWLGGRLGGGAPWKNLQTTYDNTMWHSLNLRKDFFKDRLNVNIYANNPFTSNYYSIMTVNSPNFHQRQKLVMHPREFGFVVSWRFGELKTQLKKTTKSIANDDVMQNGQNGQSDGK